MLPTKTCTLPSRLGRSVALRPNGTDTLVKAKFNPYTVARTFGASEVELPLAEFTMLSGEKDGACSSLPCAPKQGHKRSTASSNDAADTKKL